MTLEQLRVLQAIAINGTYRAAAKAMNKSQPALSHMIKSLEAEIGFSLFDREGYRPVLTARGETFFRQARLVLERMRDLSGLADRLAGRHEPEVGLSISATCPIPPVVECIGRVGQRFPQTHIRLSADVMGGSAERLLAGEVEIAIAPMDGIESGSIDMRAFATVDIVPVAHPDYGPARIDRRLSDEDMGRFVQVIVSDTGHGPFERSRDVLPYGLRWTVSDFTAKKEIILAGMGWGGLPAHLIREELQSGRLVQLDLESYPIRHSQLHVARRRDRPVGVVAEALWQALAEKSAV